MVWGRVHLKVDTTPGPPEGGRYTGSASGPP